MLTTELAAGEKLRTIPGENVARMKIELSLSEADSFAKDTLARIRGNLGAELVVLGSYLALGEKAGGQIRLDLRLQDASAGETIASVAETGTEPQLFDLVTRSGARLRQRLGVAELTSTQAGELRGSLPSNPEAAKLHSEGLAKLRLFDTLAARDLLEKAVLADPKHPLAHSTLAAAWSALGYDARASQEAKKAFELSANLSREDRLLVEGRYREAIRRPTKRSRSTGRCSTSSPTTSIMGSAWRPLRPRLAREKTPFSRSKRSASSRLLGGTTLGWILPRLRRPDPCPTTRGPTRPRRKPR